MPQILAALTGGPARNAANAQRDLYGNILNAGLPMIGVGEQRGLDFLGTGRDAALGQLGTGIGQGRTDLTGGFGAARGDIQSGGQAALDYLGTGTGAARGALGQAGQAYAPLETLAARYGGATDLLLGALGTRGQGGYDQALSAFREGPQFESGLNRGLDAISRRRNAQGMNVSGNADRDAQIFGQDLQNQEWGNYLNRLSGFMPAELAATSGAATGRAGVGRDLANLEAGYGRDAANIAGGTGRALGALEAQGGQSLADLALRGGLAGAGIETGYGTGAAGQTNTAMGQRLGLLGGLTDAYGQTYGQQAAAEQQASGNLLNLGQNVLRAVGGTMWGGGPFGGGGGGSLFGSGGGGGSGGGSGMGFQPNFLSSLY